ncbi:MAG: hypothetical protein AMDU4_FER2C00096G0002 [Ferroplasma sp. Type II]|nr:MAG: hypothetical protein AMDU4_FER2C00096G0002 [Ferroplasma sp. Type II]
MYKSKYLFSIYINMNNSLKTYFPHFSKGVFFEFHSGLNSSSDMPINDNISPCISEISV